MSFDIGFGSGEHCRGDRMGDARRPKRLKGLEERSSGHGSGEGLSESLRPGQGLAQLGVKTPSCVSK